MPERFITPLDYVLAVIYIFIIYRVAYWFRNKFYPKGHAWRPYFLPALTFKIGGAVFIGLVYYYYYGGGDTFDYFYHVRVINSAFPENTATWWRILFHNALPDATDSFYTSQMYWYDGADTLAVCSISSFVGIFCFTKYLPLVCLLAAFSFTGIWALFRTFAVQYPYMIKKIAIATLFMPSVAVWGSGLFKDTYCMFAIGWLCYCMYRLIDKGEIKLKYVIMIVLTSAMLYIIKPYLLFLLLPCLLLKSFLFFVKTKKNARILIIAFSLFFVFNIGKLYTIIEPYLAKYSFEKMGEVAVHSKNWLLSVSIESDGSAYDLGDFEPSLNGMLAKFLPSVNVTLFRPYIWEAKKPLILFNALESLFLLLFTIWLFIKRSILQIFRSIYTDPNQLSNLVFSVLLAFFTGITTYNFGSLSRYKIPLIPFYVLFLFIAFYPPPKQLVETTSLDI